MRFLIVLSCLFVFATCVEKSHKEKAKKKDQDGAAWVYQFYHQDPQNQTEIEENAIIEHLVDKDLMAARTEQGIYFVIEEEGVGPDLRPDEEVKVEYRGYFLDGKEFDSTYRKGQAYKFQIGKSIMGWNIGLLRFKSKGKGKLFIPSRFAYGEKGLEGFIPPNTPLAYDIHVIY